VINVLVRVCNFREAIAGSYTKRSFS